MCRLGEEASLLPVSIFSPSALPKQAQEQDFHQNCYPMLSTVGAVCHAGETIGNLSAHLLVRRTGELGRRAIISPVYGSVVSQMGPNPDRHEISLL